MRRVAANGDPKQFNRARRPKYLFSGLTKCAECGGGYVMYKNAPVVYRSSEEIREMIIDWVESHKTIPSQPTNNWKLLP